VNDRERRALKRITLMFAVVRVAFLVGLATRSVHAFELTALAGLVVTSCLRFTRFGW
jgi:hypothetical protein